MKKILRMVVLILSILILFYLQFGRDVSAKATTVMSFNNGYVENIDIVANKLFILDKEKFAEKMVQKCKDNNFTDILFSYDIRGYPSELNLNIYNNELARRYGIRAFQVEYKQFTGEVHEYNIRDNSDKFKLIITE